MHEQHPKATLATPALLVVYASILLGMLPMAAMPVFVGGYVDHLHFSVVDAGRIASAESLGAAAGAIFTAIVLARPGVNLRNAIMISIGTMTIAHLGSGLLSNIWAFGSTRFIVGLAAGTLNAIAAVYISSLPKPDRAFAVSFGLLSVTGPLGLWCVPPLIEAIGLPNVYLAFAAILVAGLPLMWLYPQKRERKDEQAHLTGKQSAAHAIGIALIWLAILINFISNGGIWIYTERIGAIVGVDAITLGRMLAAAMLLGTTGTMLVSLIGDRFGRVKPLLLAHSTLAAAILWLLTSPGAIGYFVAILALNMSVNVLTPYFMALLSQNARDDGRAAVVGHVATMIGYGIGPGALSFFIGSKTFDAAYIVAALGVALSMALTISGILFLRRPKDAPAVVFANAQS